MGPAPETTGQTSTGIAYDRAGPPAVGDRLPVVLLHAGIADRRMWDPQWPALTAAHDVVRLDLRGYGDSVARPAGLLDPPRDVAETLAELGTGRCHLVGASFGAGVAVEVALTRPDLVASLVLVAPGGSLIPGPTPDLDAFVADEDAALGSGDLEAAAEVDVRWWVDGPGRGPDVVPATVRDAVRRMQRRAFEVTEDWDDVEEAELDPPALERLGEVDAPTLVLTGGADLDAIGHAADAVVAGVRGARLTQWPGTAHLPSLERPEEFGSLLLAWLADR